MGGYLARKKVIAVKMRHVRQSSFVHKRSIHFGFQANISVLGCLNHTTLTCPSAETERADLFFQDGNKYFINGVRLPHAEELQGKWMVLSDVEQKSVCEGFCMCQKTNACPVSFPRSERNGDCGWCLIIQVRVKR